MANKLMKRCSKSYAIGELQIKMTMKYHYTPIGMTKIQNTDNTKFWQGCGTTVTFIHCYWECKMVQPLWKSLAASYKTKRTVTLQSSNPLLPGIYPKELKTPHKNLHMVVYKSLLYNCQNLETTKMSFNR